MYGNETTEPKKKLEEIDPRIVDQVLQLEKEKASNVILLGAFMMFLSSLMGIVAEKIIDHSYCCKGSVKKYFNLRLTMWGIILGAAIFLVTLTIYFFKSKKYGNVSQCIKKAVNIMTDALGELKCYRLDMERVLKKELSLLAKRCTDNKNFDEVFNIIDSRKFIKSIFNMINVYYSCKVPRDFKGFKDHIRTKLTNFFENGLNRAYGLSLKKDVSILYQ